MVNRLEIQLLIDQGKFRAALQVIENLETEEDLNLEDQFSCKLLKSQVLSKTGDTKKGLVMKSNS
ncbi:MAG: hypothetical protein ACXAEU_07345 [Candidatus Hodarchaeales archaeon]|jgi:hypothetical protein